jgi:hypothetical protein
LKHYLLSITLALATYATTASARLGFTLDECKAKYGDYTQLTSKYGRTFYRFHVDGITLDIDLDANGKVYDLLYWGGNLSLDQAKEILSRNGTGWIIDGSNSSETTWTKDKGKASEAGADFTDGDLWIGTQQSIDALNAAKEKAEEHKLKDF